MVCLLLLSNEANKLLLQIEGEHRLVMLKNNEWKERLLEEFVRILEKIAFEKLSQK